MLTELEKKSIYMFLTDKLGYGDGMINLLKLLNGLEDTVDRHELELNSLQEAVFDSIEIPPELEPPVIAPAVPEPAPAPEPIVVPEPVVAEPVVVVPEPVVAEPVVVVPEPVAVPEPAPVVPAAEPAAPVV